MDRRQEEKTELGTYQLWRQYDNVHKFLIDSFTCKADAVKAMEEFEKLHRKQTNLIEKIK